MGFPSRGPRPVRRVMAPSVVVLLVVALGCCPMAHRRRHRVSRGWRCPERPEPWRQPVRTGSGRGHLAPTPDGDPGAPSQTPASLGSGPTVRVCLRKVGRGSPPRHRPVRAEPESLGHHVAWPTRHAIQWRRAPAGRDAGGGAGAPQPDRVQPRPDPLGQPRAARRGGGDGAVRGWDVDPGGRQRCLPIRRQRGGRRARFPGRRVLRPAGPGLQRQGARQRGGGRIPAQAASMRGSRPSASPCRR